jgi:hypothetical protein
MSGYGLESCMTRLSSTGHSFFVCFFFFCEMVVASLGIGNVKEVAPKEKKI